MVYEASIMNEYCHLKNCTICTLFYRTREQNSNPLQRNDTLSYYGVPNVSKLKKLPVFTYPRVYL